MAEKGKWILSPHSKCAGVGTPFATWFTKFYYRCSLCGKEVKNEEMPLCGYLEKCPNCKGEMGGYADAVG